MKCTMERKSLRYMSCFLWIFLILCSPFVQGDASEEDLSAAKDEESCFCGNDSWSWKDVLKSVGLTFGLGILAKFTIPVLVSLIGFTPGGIAAGSIGAALMAGKYAPWLVGFLQSVGAAGITWVSSLLWGLVSGSSYWALKNNYPCLCEKSG